MVRVVLSLSNAVIALDLEHKVYRAWRDHINQGHVPTVRRGGDGHVYDADADDQITLFRELRPERNVAQRGHVQRWSFHFFLKQKTIR